MDKKRLGYFLGSILIILGIISFIVIYFDPRAFEFGRTSWGGSCPTCVIMANPFFYSGLICSILGIIILGYSLYKRKAKGSGIDEQMKRVYHLSIGLLICGWTLFIMNFIGFLFLGFFLGFIGLLIGFVGLYGIIIYRSRPDKLRNYLLKRNESKEEHKVQA